MRSDGLRLAPHVGFPRVRARLASAAGLLLAAERPADFRTARTDIDVRDATVAAFRGQEQLGLGQVLRDQARREPLHDVVVAVDRIVNRVIGEYIEDRRESLVLRRLDRRLQLHDRRPHVIAGLAPGRSRARRHARAARGACLIERGLHRSKPALLDERPDELSEDCGSPILRLA